MLIGDTGFERRREGAGPAWSRQLCHGADISSACPTASSLGGSRVGRNWPGPWAAVLLSPWLGPPQAQPGPGSKAEGDL